MLLKTGLEEAEAKINVFFDAINGIIKADPEGIQPEAEAKFNAIVESQDQLWMSKRIIFEEIGNLKSFVDQVNSAGEV